MPDILAGLEEFCDRIAVRHGGRLIYTGPPADLVPQEGGVNLERAFLSVLHRLSLIGNDQ